MRDQPPPAAPDIVERLRDEASGQRAAFSMGIDAPAVCPITLNAAADEIVRLRAVLRECADDLETEIKARYPAQVQIYPSEKRRFDRDMEMVNRARELLK